MNFDPSQAPPALLHTLNVLWLLVVLHAAKSTRWRILCQHTFTFHLFFGIVLALTMLAMLRTGVKSGLAIHLLGITTATLIMGWKLAILAGSVALCLLTISGYEAPMSLGINACCQVLTPTLISYRFCRLLQRRLPHNPFIFTIGAGFFGGILALGACMVSTALLLYLMNTYSANILWEKYLRFMPIAIYPEGFINGLCISAMVAFHPKIISTFNPHSYFKDPKP